MSKIIYSTLIILVALFSIPAFTESLPPIEAFPNYKKYPRKRNDEKQVYSKKKDKFRYYLSAVAIFRDEADYLKEWIEYHYMLGVEHFYLYNNLSVDNYRDVLIEYINKGLVELIDWPYEHEKCGEWDRIQRGSYVDALKRCKKQTKWLAILDTDEYIVPIKHDNIPTLLGSLEKKDPSNKTVWYTIRWVVFGTSGVYRVPEDQLMIEMLTKNGGPHQLYKSIVQPKYVNHKVEKINPHWVIPTSKKKIGQKIPLDVAQINHYMYRDQYFFYNVKIPRREKFGTDRATLEKWESHCNIDTVYSDKILRFIPSLKKKMGLD